MDNSEIQLVGGPCGQHGPYTFYKAFKYTKNGVKRIVTLSEFFFVKLWIDSDLLCIGELQLLWSDKNSDQVLASLRLYFLPENTPEGRMDHGEPWKSNAARSGISRERGALPLPITRRAVSTAANLPLATDPIQHSLQ
ncbi:hypothetical protein Zmor_002464 [Zophobas morio]|uniref:AT-rich interactive domain-containing protein 5B n=1 Tax=Zophobas morio TaxID=2755281 RepID=A0AA38MQ69_9CUCU|nr:hypothetical protein Zmor_002464 [Zophobas morio]